MFLKKILPCDSLKAYVSSFWLLDSLSDLSLQDTVFPMGSLEVVFNLGNATLTSFLDNRPVINPRVELVGQSTRPYPIQVSGHNVLLGIRFHPYSAGLFLKNSLGQLTNSILDASAVLGLDIDRLYTRLLEAKTVDDQIHQLERFLVRQLDHKQQALNRYQRVRFMVEQLLIHPHDTHVDKLAAYHRISTRYLHALFVEFVGLPPKQFLKIIRLQKGFACLQHQTGSLTDVAYTSGYFDQSHFIRDFKAFTGLTPSEYQPQSFRLPSGRVGKVWLRKIILIKMLTPTLYGVA